MPTSNRKKQHSQGFNLIESAIVLGVIGLVLGGIWLGAGAVINANNISQFKSDITTSLKKIQETFSPKVGCNLPLTYMTTTPSEANKLGFFPESWFRPHASNPIFDRTISPTGIYVSFSGSHKSSSGGQVYNYTQTLSLSSLDKASCIQIAPHLGKQIPLLLESMTINGGTSLTTTFSPEEAATYCTSSESNIIRLVLRLC